MRDAHLKHVDSERLATEAIRHWAGELSSLAHVQSSENFVFRFHQGDPALWFYLRLTHSGHRSHEQLLAELDFVLYLKSANCHVCCPIPSLADHWVEPLVQNGTLWHACVFEAAPGTRVEENFDRWDRSLFQKWGRSLGATHIASKQFNPSGARRFRWDEDDVLSRAWDYLPAEETAARQELKRVQNWLETHPEVEECFGLIHGDLCCANFHFDGHHITAFDFDDSLYHWFVYDLVCALAPMVFHPHRHLFRDWVIEGYQQVNSLPEMWEEEFDWFLRLRGLYLFILNLRHWEAPIDEHPKRDFLVELRHCFEQPICW